MFYSHQILAKKGPLGTIWIAAHMDRKLRKNQIAETCIGDSVGEWRRCPTDSKRGTRAEGEQAGGGGAHPEWAVGQRARVAHRASAASTPCRFCGSTPAPGGPRLPHAVSAAKRVRKRGALCDRDAVDAPLA